MAISIGAWKSGRAVPEKKAKAFAKRLADSAITCICLMLNPGVKPWHLPKWKGGDLAATTRACQALGIEVWWVFWAVSKQKAVEEQLAALEGLLAHATPDGIEFDAEESWRKPGIQLADPLVAGVRAAVGQGSEVQLAITSVPHLSGIQRDELALFEAGQKYGFKVEGRPQAYSTYQKPKPGKSSHWSWPSFFRPGPIQHHALALFRPLRDQGLCQRIRMGLASWAQNHPAPYPRGAEAVAAALDTTVADGDIDAVCYWRWSAIQGSASIQKVLKRAAGSLVYTFDDPQAPRGPDIKEAQGRLLAAGYNPGPIDGVLGPRTRAAAAAYSRDVRGIMPDDVRDDRLLELIAELHLGWEEVA